MKQKVLVLDDEVLVAYDLANTVEALGHKPLGPACSIDEAFALLDEDKPDCALLDIDVGGMPVWPVARRLKAMDCPMAFVSANANHTELAEEFCFAPVVDKPASEADIGNALRDIF